MRNTNFIEETMSVSLIDDQVNYQFDTSIPEEVVFVDTEQDFAPLSGAPFQENAFDVFTIFDTSLFVASEDLENLPFKEINRQLKPTNKILSIAGFSFANQGETSTINLECLFSSCLLSDLQKIRENKYLYLVAVSETNKKALVKFERDCSSLVSLENLSINFDSAKTVVAINAKLVCAIDLK